MGDPKILILDEPTAGLDPNERISLRNLIAREAMDKIVILATHIISDIDCVADHIILMKREPTGDVSARRSGWIR